MNRSAIPAEVFLLRALIRREGLRPAFQPIVHIESGSVIGYEALSRPDHPDLGAGHAFDVAVQAGLAGELETLAIRQISRAVGQWRPGSLLFVNCSSEAIADEDFRRQLLCLIASGVPPRRTVIELTERESEAPERHLTSLRRLGFPLAIDDVGAGVNGLRRILHLRPDWMKLDRDLVSRVTDDPMRRYLIGSLVDFSSRAGIRLIAEGIETGAELRTIRRLGVRFAQGYYLGRPHRLGVRLPPAKVCMRSA